MPLQYPRIAIVRLTLLVELLRTSLLFLRVFLAAGQCLSCVVQALLACVAR